MVLLAMENRDVSQITQRRGRTGGTVAAAVAPGVLKRLLVCAMSVTLVWQLAREQDPKAEELRGILVRLSGRQMVRGTKKKPGKGFTEPALLAGLGILLPMLALMEHTQVDALRELVAQALGLSPRCDNSA